MFTRNFPSGTCDKHQFNDFVRREFVDVAPRGKFQSIMEAAQTRYHGSVDRVKPTIDVLEWLSFVTPRLYVEMQKKRREIPKHFTWTLEDSQKMDRMLARMDTIAKIASDTGKKVMIDAEQTYFQPAIDALTIELQRRHNVDGHVVVYSTIQAYLKDSSTRLGFFLECAQREQWAYACKIVRGAYLVQERNLAQNKGLPSPVHDTIDNTALSYYKCCELVLTQPNTNLVVASHNPDSISQVLTLMQSLERSDSVAFAQLYSMADGVTFALAENGYRVFKYLPFGEVNMVVPYLIRRGQENSSVIDGAANERKLMWQELVRRILHDPWFPSKPQATEHEHQHLK